MSLINDRNYAFLQQQKRTTHGILSIRDAHETTVMVGGVRVSGEVLGRQDVEIDEPGREQKLISLCFW